MAWANCQWTGSNCALLTGKETFCTGGITRSGDAAIDIGSKDVAVVDESAPLRVGSRRHQALEARLLVWIVVEQEVALRSVSAVAEIPVVPRVTCGARSSDHERRLGIGSDEILYALRPASGRSAIRACLHIWQPASIPIHGCNAICSCASVAGRGSRSAAACCRYGKSTETNKGNEPLSHGWGLASDRKSSRYCATIDGN